MSQRLQSLTDRRALVSSHYGARRTLVFSCKDYFNTSLCVRCHPFSFTSMDDYQQQAEARLFSRHLWECILMPLGNDTFFAWTARTADEYHVDVKMYVAIIQKKGQPRDHRSFKKRRAQRGVFYTGKRHKNGKTPHIIAIVVGTCSNVDTSEWIFFVFGGWAHRLDLVNSSLVCVS
jgi:hypothetical protein